MAAVPLVAAHTHIVSMFVNGVDQVGKHAGASICSSLCHEESLGTWMILKVPWF
jgi:hypothetical protein